MILVGFDRDGTINEGRSGEFGADDNWVTKLKIYPDASKAIKMLDKDNIKVIIATNQSSVALGVYSISRMRRINSEINRRLRAEGARIDGWYSAPYLSPAFVRWRGVKARRKWIKANDLMKPGIGMLRRAARDLRLNWDKLVAERKIYFIGDRVTDVQVALNANGTGVFVRNKETLERNIEAVRHLKKQYKDRVFIVNGLVQAAKLILKRSKSN